MSTTKTTTAADDNHIHKIAIVGATGQIGTPIVSALLASSSNKFTITALTRSSSSTPIPKGIVSVPISYDSHDSLVSALKGQDVLIITLSVRAPPDTQAKLITAAADAGVPFVFPNVWGCDPSDPIVAKDMIIGDAIRGATKSIEEKGVGKWIGVVTGFWYEYSVALGPWSFGFDWTKAKGERGGEVTFMSGGETKMCTSTFEQVGRAMAALLSLPIRGEPGRSLDSFANQWVYISSFRVSQRDMLDSILRVTGDQSNDWTIKHEDAQTRYEEGQAEMKNPESTPGERQLGFAKQLYSRFFYPGKGANDFEDKLSNDVLGLPKEDLDASTRRAVEMARARVSEGLVGSVHSAN